MSNEHKQNEAAADLQATASSELTKPADEQQHDNGLKLRVVNYKPTARQGYVLTVVVDLNGRMIFRDQVTVDSFKSRERFARGLAHALERQFGWTDDTETLYRLVSMWAEIALLAEAQLIQDTWGDDWKMALSILPVAGHS